MDSILDKLKAAYFATHGSSFPLTGNKYVVFKYYCYYIPVALSSLFPIIISSRPFVYTSAQFVYEWDVQYNIDQNLGTFLKLLYTEHISL